MVVPKDELGPEARGLERDEDSGPSDNAAGAEDTLDPNDTARDLRSAGRIQGYDLYFTGFSALVGDAAIGATVLIRSGVASGWNCVPMWGPMRKAAGPAGVRASSRAPGGRPITS